MRESFEKGSSRPLLSTVLWRILPLSILVLVAIWIIVIQVSERSLIQETNARIEQKVEGLTATTESRLVNILSVVRNLSSNSLMVKALMDLEGEDQEYMEAFFRSLQIADLTAASISLLDYRGRTIIGPEENDLNEQMIEQLMSGEELLEINPNLKLFHFAVPVYYHGRSEGVLVLDVERRILMNYLGRHLPAEASLIRTRDQAVLYSGRWGADDDLGTAADLNDEAVISEHQLLTLFPDISVYYAEERSVAFAALERLHQTLLIVLALDLVALMVGIYMAGRAVVLPVNQFTRQLESLQQEGAVEMVAKHGRALEINTLVDAFNQLQQIKQQLTDDLRRQYEDMEHIFSSMSEPLLIIGAGRKIVQVNPAAEALIGGERQQPLVGRPIADLVGEGEEGEVVVMAADGEKIPVIRSISTLTSLSSSPRRSVWVLHDLRERLKAEQQEQYASFQAGIVEMGASVLHNVGNAVTGMTGYVLGVEQQVRMLERITPLLVEQGEQCKQLSQSLSDAPEVANKIDHYGEVFIRSGKVLEKVVGEAGIGDYLIKLQHSVQHVGEIISIQQSAAQPVVQASHFMLESVITDTLSLIQNSLDKYRTTVEVDLDPQVEMLYLPRNPLIQLLLNLLKNSIESIGEVMVREVEHVGKIIVHSKRLDDQRIELVITDNGEGVSEDQQGQIFQAGFSTKERGSGFGLHSAANFVSSLGGKISLQNRAVDQGAILRIELPIAVKEDE